MTVAPTDLLYMTDVSLLAGSRLFDAALAAVPAYRREKVNRLRMPADRMLSLGAGLLLRRAMRVCGIPEDAPLSEQGNGKPVFPDYPDFHFNLSHSGTMAVCAVSPHDVGCDIEKDRADSLKIARRFFLPEEYAHIASFRTEAEQTQEFFRYWTMKEAFMKVTGMGMKLPPDAFAIVPEGDGYAVRQTYDDRKYFLSSHFAGPGYSLSVCKAEKPFYGTPWQTDVRDLL